MFSGKGGYYKRKVSEELKFTICRGILYRRSTTQIVEGMKNKLLQSGVMNDTMPVALVLEVEADQKRYIDQVDKNR